MKKIKPFILVCLLFLGYICYGQEPVKIVNDVTQLNPIKVSLVIEPTSTEEIIQAVKTHRGPISIGGGRFSMGGQTATEDAVQLDMRKFDKIIAFSKEKKEISVQTGITWRKIQEFIDSFDLSVKIMQTYANFTVGGSLSVNVHGRYIGQGPIIMSVKSIKIVLANGELIIASPEENKEIFYSAIGGYGGIGVITEATLSLTENCKVEQKTQLMPISAYKDFFFQNIRNDTSIIFHNADIYPGRYQKVRSVSYFRTDKNVTITYRLKPNNKKYRFNRFAFKLISIYPGGKWIRQHIFDPLIYSGKSIEWRNFEASYDVMELEPKSRKKSTYVLQEYFIPIDSFDSFYPKMVSILKSHHVNVINISIRHAKKDPGSMMAWAKTEVFAFVIYYKQGTSSSQKERVKIWTRKLIDCAISCKGSYYLPYQIHATQDEFEACYPDAINFFALKKKLDPTNKFRNKLWDAYYK